MFSELLKYNHCANRIFIEQFDACDQEMPKAEQLFSHILNAQHVWISRINQVPSVLAVWDIHPKQKFRQLEEEHYAGFKNILLESDFMRPVYYKSSVGEFTNTVSEILFQAFNHATYHRGQIATIFKTNGINPPLTDYIFLKHEGRL